MASLDPIPERVQKAFDFYPILAVAYDLRCPRETCVRCEGTGVRVGITKFDVVCNCCLRYVGEPELDKRYKKFKEQNGPF